MPSAVLLSGLGAMQVFLTTVPSKDEMVILSVTGVTSAPKTGETTRGWVEQMVKQVRNQPVANPLQTCVPPTSRSHRCIVIRLLH